MSDQSMTVIWPARRPWNWLVPVACAVLVLVADDAAAITGRVTAGGLSVQGATVTVIGQYGGTAVTDATGTWTYNVPSQAPDQALFRVLVTATGYVQQLYPNLPCLSVSTLRTCDLNAGILVNRWSAGVDFALVQGGTITGVVGSPSGPIPGALVQLVTTNAQGSRTTFLEVLTTAQGVYRFDDLPDRAYFIWAGQPPGEAGGGYVAEFFADTPCSTTQQDAWAVVACAVTAGDPIQVAGAATVTANLDLQPGGAVAGTFTGNGAPLLFADKAIRIQRADGLVIASTRGDETGAYAVRGLPAGTYYLVGVGSGWQTELYNDVPCTYPNFYCEGMFALGTPVTVTAGAVATGRNVDLARPTPFITGQPQSAIIAAGTQTFVSALVYGPETPAFQWYRGVAGDVTSPIAGAVDYLYWTPLLTAQAKYWVRVTNSWGMSTNSQTATIDIGVAPAISGQPSGKNIASGQTATLIVQASGTPAPNYQWYRGPSGVTTTPVAGATSSAFTTPALTATTSYWVRASNAFGAADSAAAVITVMVPPTIVASPVSQSIDAGQTAALAVTTTGTAPLAYQWYRGASGVISSPIGGATASTFVTPPLTTTTSYWVRVANAVGAADSTAATVTVTGLFPPTIVTSPASQSIDLGQTATLAVTAASTVPVTYQWYQGVSGVISSPVAGATASTFTTPALTTTTSYWVRVSNTYGSADSAAAIITVLGSTTPAPPSALTVESVVGTLVTLRWTPPAAGPAPTGYVLQGGLQAGVMLVAVPTGSSDPIFTFVAPAGSFFIRMVAVAGAEESTPSNEVPLHVSVPVPPSAPEALTGLADGDALDLTWKNTFGGGPPTSLALDVAGAATTSVPLPLSERFSFRGVPGGTYTFRLRALNSGGSGPESVPVTLSFPGTCTSPGPPRRVLAYRVGGTVSIVWDPPATGAAPTGYVLGVVSSVFTGELPLPGRGLSAPVPAGSYTFTVRSINTCGQSAPSAPQTVLVP